MSENTTNQAFGQRIKALRKDRGLTQEQLAEAIGRSLDTVSNIERGANSTRIETANKIAAALGTDLSDLFNWPQASKGNAEKKKLIQDLLKLAEAQAPDTITAIIEQAKILIRQSKV